MARFLRWSAWGLSALLLFILIALIGGFFWLRGSLPQLEGERAMAGLAAPVEVLRDRDGIVTIRAQSQADAYRALGFVHAQDRLWQMDFMRLTAKGRLSEVVGTATLGHDRLLRGLGFEALAKANLKHLSPEAMALLEAYSAGVNDFIAEPDGPWPLGFQILRWQPEPWQPSDSILWGRLMALRLSSDWQGEALRLRLSQTLSLEDMRFLWPDWQEQGPTTVANLGPLAKQVRLPQELLPDHLSPLSASNLWSVTGDRSMKSGALLANDPHLGLNAPGLWYLVRIETPDLTLAGATAPGVPFHIFGHNESFAWALTSTEADVQDLFIERLIPEQEGHYETPEGAEPFETHTELIKVRGLDPVEVRYRRTRHGPVVGDLNPKTADPDSNQVLALAWPALAEDDRSGEALYRLNRARNKTDYLNALKAFDSPVQNLAFADRNGDIGFRVAGRIPIRPKGPSLLPVPGWTGEYDWQGLIPFESLPEVINPTSQTIVNANNRVVGPDFPYPISAQWPAPTRAERIIEVLSEQPKWSAEGFRELQMDSVSMGAQGLLPLLLKMLEQSPPAYQHAQQAKALLENWDAVMDRNKAAPLIFVAWTDVFSQRLLRPKLGSSVNAVRRGEPWLLNRILTERPQWCDEEETEATESCAQQAALTFDLALVELKSRFGGIPEDWRWGDAHRARFPHPVFSRVPLLERLIGFGVETDGGAETVNRAVPRLGGAKDHRYNDIHGPGYRGVYDLFEPDNSLFMIATGQSGNPLSPFYGNLAERWRDGDAVKLVGAEQAPAFRLRLIPR